MIYVKISLFLCNLLRKIYNNPQIDRHLSCWFRKWFQKRCPILCNTNTINDETSSSPVISGLENNGLLALEQQLYRFDDEFEFIYTNMINAKWLYQRSSVNRENRRVALMPPAGYILEALSYNFPTWFFWWSAYRCLALGISIVNIFWGKSSAAIEIETIPL